jgi:ATP-dependent helicase/DNAse subunit B
MPNFHSIINEPSLRVLLKHLETADHSKQLILVGSAVDQTMLRRALQEKLGGLSPKVEVLNRQLASWLKFGVEPNPSTLFLTPTERRMALSLWSTENVLDLQSSQLDRLNRMLSWIYVQGLDPLLHLDFFGDYARNVSDFLRWMVDRSWVDRSALFLFASKLTPDIIGFEEVHLYVPGIIEKSQQKALEEIIGQSEGRVHWHWYAYLETYDQSKPSRSPASVFTLSSGSVRLELEHVFRHIKSLFIASEWDNERPHTFSDIMILVSDMDRYMHHIEMAAHRFEVPITSSQGPMMISDPAIGRLRQYIYLSAKDFQIEHIVDVFADQLIPLLSQLTDAMESPNLRTFGSFCKRYNIRNLHQLERELDRALQRETERIEAIVRKTRPESINTDKPNFEQIHGEFYRDIRNRLTRLRQEYLEGTQTMSEWYRWAKMMLDRLGVVKDPELMNGLRSLSRTIDKVLASIGRLGYDPMASAQEFAEAFDSFLNLRMTRNQHPGAVLVAPFEESGFVDGKWVFVVGMSDGVLPRSSRIDEIFPKASKSSLMMLQSMEKDHFEDARQRLSLISRDARRLTLSWPTMVGGRSAMVSSLVLDAASLFPDWQLTEVGSIEVDGCLDRLDLTIEASKYGYRKPEDLSEILDQVAHARLVSAIVSWRSDPDEIGIWEGMLSSRTPWESALEGIRQRGWERLTKSGNMRMSVTRFDEFAQSPLEYFFKRVLRLEKPDEYNDEAEQNRKGDLLHSILDHFYSNSDLFGPPIHPIDDLEAARDRMRKIAEFAFIERVEDLGHPDTPYPELLKTQMLKTLEGFIETERSGLPQLGAQARSLLKPAVLWDPNQLATEIKFEININVDELPVTIHGFIDRIDTSADLRMQLVYDYKTGSQYSIKSFAEDTNQGMSFQLPIYLHSIDTIEEPQLMAAYYHLSISKEGQDIRLKGLLGDLPFIDDPDKKLKQKDFKGVMDSATRRMFVEAIIERRVKPIIRAIRDGRFHQSLTKPSEYSDYQRISRWSQAVSDMRNIALVGLDQDPQDIFNRMYIKMPVVGVFNPESYSSMEASDE